MHPITLLLIKKAYKKEWEELATFNSLMGGIRHELEQVLGSKCFFPMYLFALTLLLENS